MERAAATDAIVYSVSGKRLILSGLGTGKSFTFRRALAKAIQDAGGGRGLALTLIQDLVADLEKDLGDLADVFTHGDRRSPDVTATTSAGLVLREGAAAADSVHDEKEAGSRGVSIFARRNRGRRPASSGVMAAWKTSGSTAIHRGQRLLRIDLPALDLGFKLS